MKTKENYFDEVYESWKEIIPVLTSLTGKPEEELLDKNLLCKNIIEIIRDSEILQKDNYEKYYIFYKENMYKIGNFIQDYIAKTENCINIDISYKGKSFSKLNIPLADAGKFQVLEYYSNAMFNVLLQYTANDEIMLEHMKKNRNYYYDMFNIEKNSLYVKLHIWKENYPKSYKYLIENFEIPSYEELCGEIE